MSISDPSGSPSGLAGSVTLVLGLRCSRLGAADWSVAGHEAGKDRVAVEARIRERRATPIDAKIADHVGTGA